MMLGPARLSQPREAVPVLRAPSHMMALLVQAQVDCAAPGRA